MHWDWRNGREYKAGDNVQSGAGFLRPVLIAARVVLKLQRTLSFTLKVFISGPSELLWLLEWHNEMDWDSSHPAFCSQMETFWRAHILFYLCKPLAHRAALTAIGSPGGHFHLITVADATRPSTKRTRGKA